MLATLQSSQAEFESPSALGLPHDYRQEEPLVSDRQVPAVVLGHLAPIQRRDAADTSFQYHSVGRALGKRRGGRTTPGSRWLRSVLVQAAWAASHTKATRLGAAYRGWVKRLGRKRALMALGHKILAIIYMLLSHGEDYDERLEPGHAA